MEVIGLEAAAVVVTAESATEEQKEDQDQATVVTAKASVVISVASAYGQQDQNPDQAAAVIVISKASAVTIGPVASAGFMFTSTVCSSNITHVTSSRDFIDYTSSYGWDRMFVTKRKNYVVEIEVKL